MANKKLLALLVTLMASTHIAQAHPLATLARLAILASASYGSFVFGTEVRKEVEREKYQKRTEQEESGRQQKWKATQAAQAAKLKEARTKLAECRLQHADCQRRQEQAMAVFAQISGQVEQK